MFPAFSRIFSARSRIQLAAISLLLVAVVGSADFRTGYELSFSVFYLIPVALAAWYGGSAVGIPVCLVSAATWLAADLSSGHQYSQPAIPFWNATVRLVFFAVVAALLVRLRGALELQALLAEQDSLTGIMNSRTLAARCESLSRLAARHGRPMALCYLDLDGFKGVNDSLGHGAGDRVLQAVAFELVRRTRASDLVARLGGDEFAIVLPETDLAGARSVFSEMRKGLLDLAATNRWPVGFSLGVAVFRVAPANFEDALRRADDLMYKVKGAGKNDILFEEYPAEARAPGDAVPPAGA